MASRASGLSLSWIVIGFLAGVAAALLVLILMSGRLGRREEASAPAPAVQPAARPAHKAPAQPPRLAQTPASAQPAPDEQVKEDAAAAGMTSRSHAAGQGQ